MPDRAIPKNGNPMFASCAFWSRDVKSCAPLARHACNGPTLLKLGPTERAKRYRIASGAPSTTRHVFGQVGIAMAHWQHEQGSLCCYFDKRTSLSNDCGSLTFKATYYSCKGRVVKHPNLSIRLLKRGSVPKKNTTLQPGSLQVGKREPTFGFFLSL